MFVSSHVWLVCLSGSVLYKRQRSYPMARPAALTGMGDRSRVYGLSISSSHPGQLSLAIPSWVLSTGDEEARKKTASSA